MPRGIDAIRWCTYSMGGEYAVIATAAVRAVESSSRMPEAIVVSIVNTDRERDFTPPLRMTSELPPGVRHAGGANAFLAFVSRELVPMIDERLRLRDQRWARALNRQVRQHRMRRKQTDECSIDGHRAQHPRRTLRLTTDLRVDVDTRLHCDRQVGRKNSDWRTLGA